MTSGVDLFRQVADEAIMGVMLAEGEELELSYINKAAIQILEIDSDPLERGALGARTFFADFVRRVPPLGREDFLQLEGHLHEIGMRKADGSVLVANVGLKRLHSQPQPTLLIMFQDVSLAMKLHRDIELKQKGLREAFNELSEQNKALAQMDEAKTRFLYLISHELRTPLTALISSAEFLLGEIYEGPEDEMMLKKTLFTQAGHLLEIVNDVLDFTKLKAGKMEYFVAAANPLEICQDVLKGFAEMSTQNGVRTELVVPTATPTCYFDSLRLRQVLSNLVSNAIKFSEAGTQVKVILEKQGDFVQIEVTDQGKGIAEDQKNMIFQEFTTLGEMSLHHQGTGLGLVISKGMMEAMGGEITFVSQVGVGSSFYLRLPCSRVLAPENYRVRIEGSINLLDEA